jgi:hypothetical protein
MQLALNNKALELFSGENDGEVQVVRNLKMSQ